MEFGIPELTDEQIEEASTAAENAARTHILSKVTQKQIESLNISIEAEGNKPVSFIVEIDLIFARGVKGLTEKSLADEALKKAFNAIENNLRRIR